MKKTNNNSICEIESFDIVHLEKKIMQLYRTYMSPKGNVHHLDCLHEVLDMRKEIINEQFVFTPMAVRHFERVNQLLVDATSKLLTKTAKLYHQMREIKQSGDDFLDDYHLHATLEISYNGKESVLQLGKKENPMISNYAAMVEIMSLCPNATYKPLRSYHLHDEETVFCPFSIEEMLVDEDWLGAWDDDADWDVLLFSIPELKHIPYISYAMRGLFVHSPYSLSDIIRIQDIHTEVNVSWRNDANLKRNKAIYDSRAPIKNRPLTEEELQYAREKLSTCTQKLK